MRSPGRRPRAPTREATERRQQSPRDRRLPKTPARGVPLSDTARYRCPCGLRSHPVSLGHGGVDLTKVPVEMIAAPFSAEGDLEFLILERHSHLVTADDLAGHD